MAKNVRGAPQKMACKMGQKMALKRWPQMAQTPPFHKRMTKIGPPKWLLPQILPSIVDCTPGIESQLYSPNLQG